MLKPKALIITGNGTNCERETANALRLAGAEPTIAYSPDILSGDVRLKDYQFLNLPGGFLDGDDLGSAKAAAVRFKYGKIGGKERFIDDLLKFIADGKLILGVCNGFQLMVKLGLLPGTVPGKVEQTASLAHNDSGRFEDRWVYLTADAKSPCIFTRGLTRIYLPVRHGEGKFVTNEPAVLDGVEKGSLSALKYCDENGKLTMEYPQNPNGSTNSIAGVCDSTGRLFGLMPHPEAFVHRTNHPRWTRENLPEEGDGLALFKNAVSYLTQA